MRISDWSSDVCSSDLRHVESKLLFLVGERIGDMLAVEVDLEAARRLADRELALAELRGMVEQGPVVELHEDVGVGKFELALNPRHQAGNLEGLALRGRGKLVLHLDAVARDGFSETLTLGLGNRRRDGLLQLVVAATGQRDHDLAFTRLVKRDRPLVV